MTNEYLVGTITIPTAAKITAITNAYPAVATISLNTVSQYNAYVVGQLVKLTVPMTYKMWQANNQTVKILAINGSDISLDMDSTQYDVFTVPGGLVSAPASMAPSGSRNLTIDNTNQTEPFQSLNNRGN